MALGTEKELKVELSCLLTSNNNNKGSNKIDNKIIKFSNKNKNNYLIK